MSLAPQLFINSLIAGAVYSLVAAGFSLIYSVNRFVHFAHGVVVAFSAYFLYLFFRILNLDFWLSIIISLILSAGFGWLMNLIYRQFRKRKTSPTVLLIAGFALLIFFESLILLLFGADVKTIGFIKIAKGIEFWGIIITPFQIVIIISSFVLLAALFFFMKYSRTGKAMRAVADNKDVAEVLGISSEKIYLWTFVIGSLIAGIAGILVGMEQNLTPSMGTHLTIKGFAGTIIGGIGSVPGAILGSFLLGLAENFGIWWLPSGYKDAIAFAILFIFLLFRPQGILGKRG